MLDAVTGHWESDRTISIQISDGEIQQTEAQNAWGVGGGGALDLKW